MRSLLINRRTAARAAAREEIKVYRLKRNVDQKHRDFTVDLTQKLNKVLHAQF